MTAPARRAPLQGVLQIVRYNWPFYASAGALIALACTAAVLLPLRGWVATLLIGGAALAAAWLLASLIASWWIYDRSPLTRWRWVGDCVSAAPASWIHVHAGLDESSAAIAALLPGARGRIFDIYDAAQMTERSIERARAEQAIAPPSERVDYRALPAADRSCDLVTLLLAVHELRAPAARREFFGEVARVLAPGGVAILAEHLRDLPNFLAFGPGFLHFHSRATWLRALGEAGLAVRREFSITPFIRVFVIGGKA